MKKMLLTLAVIMVSCSTYAQTNIYESGGNVGIGITNPNYKLHVIGDIGINQPYAFKFANGQEIRDNGNGGLSIYSTGSINNVISNNGYYSINGGDVGIGTISPRYRLDVIKQATGSGLNITGLAIGTRNDTGIDFSALNGISVNYAKIGLQITSGIIGQEIGGLTFFTVNNGSLSEKMFISGSGNVGIGITNPQEKLAVNGTIHSQVVKVDLDNWPDYVFKPAYKLPSLVEVKTYIDENQHLPDMPSEQEVTKNGLNLGEIVKVQTRKIEELTLYLIEENKRNQKQEQQINELRSQLAKLIEKK